MEKVKLKNLEVSKLCFGTLPLSPLQREVSPEQAGELLAAAFDLGVNFIDTAQIYRNYPHICDALSRTQKDIIISTKTYAHTAELAAEALEEARQELQRDVIDIFLLHEQESEHTLRGHAAALDYLYAQKAAGKIRAVGISTHHIAGVKAATDAKLDILHPIINIDGLGIVDGNRDEMTAAIKAAQNAGIGVFSMKALGGGNLYKKPADALGFAMDICDSVAVGIRDRDELYDDVYFFENRKFPEIGFVKKNAPRKLYIADWCSGCGNCAMRCGFGAMTLENNKAVCNPEYCMLCGYCSRDCKDFCIKIV